ncbi:MAG: kelch repeat-containing protein [Elusimicrobiota bacterium]|nr:kelch repeat-containing protein [Elusimicrobiota bacterium]
MNFRKVLALSLLAPALLVPGAGALGTTINARFGHTSTLLPDGNILITGGTSNTATVTGSVEMYDMSTNLYINWTGGITARSSHTATLMSDGRVLIAGGFATGGTPMSSLEICDPTVRTCAAAGVAMLTARGGHTATLLSRGLRAGQVLLCGGQSAAANTTITELCETYDPVTNTRATAGPMVSPRMGQAATLLRSGRVFVTGGRLWNTAALPIPAWFYETTNEMFDPEGGAAGAGSWTPVSALNSGRIGHTATVLNNGKIMIAGGYNAARYLYCQAPEPDSLEDECWHIEYDIADTQGAGNWGYLDGAEFFDPNGARVVLAEETYGEIPYRVSQQSAVLEPDGRWRMHGGYGNIVPTFFTNSPALTTDSIIYLTLAPALGLHHATINNAPTPSIIKFPLKFPLARPVSGMLVNADAFISPPSDSKVPSFTIDTAEFLLPRSRAPVDGFKVGLHLGDKFDPGDFDGRVTLASPTGTAVFPKTTVSSGESPNTTSISVSGMNLALDLYPSKTGTITGGLTANVKLTLPSTFRSVVGVASVLGGTILDNGNQYSIVFKSGGTGTFDIPGAPISCVDDSCVFEDVTVAFTGLSGEMTNLTTLESGTTYYATVNPSTNGLGVNPQQVLVGDPIVLSLELDYIARQVSALDREPTYNFDRSTMVIRGMIFSSELAYTPNSNTWADLADKQVSPAMEMPSFNHTALLTPAGDTAIIGGRNCENAPTVDCLRTAMTFNAQSVDTTFIPVYTNQAGTIDWPLGNSLVSKRAFHTSTLLPDGRILTCGGSDGVKPLSTCELMDPLTKTWAATAPMYSPRANHTATLLPNGNVLAAGGITPSGIAVNSAEIFYSQTGRWVPTSSLANARQLHTATLMPDGNVLVTGGSTLSSYSNSAEIYITSAALWINGGTLGYGRSQHTATLLKNGNVLLAGGVTSAGATSRAEVYNYTSRTFADTGNTMTRARYSHTANQLRDGSVIVIGGTDNTESMNYSEIFDGTWWSPLLDINGDDILLKYARANHRSVLLPNGKLMVTGGEMRGTAQSAPASFDPDYKGWSTQGSAAGRTHHTSILTKDNLVMNIGGWSGGAYLDTTEYADFNFSPDMNGLQAETTRQTTISSGTVLFDYGARATLLNDASNFHGITEASGGGAGSANSSFHNPRVYMQQIDNPSGFMVDLSTRIYSRYDAANPNPSWENTLSSITLNMPNLPGVMPYGWYHMRVAAAGVFSNGATVQVAGPRPTGTPTAPVGATQGTSSITWTWEQGTVTAADGYSIYSATDNVFIATTAFVNGAVARYTQTNLIPNTAVSIKVAGYNLGGDGLFSKSATYYTLAAVPTPLRINSASFETVALEWTRNANSVITTYEVSMSKVKTIKFSDALAISTPVPFSVNLMSTSTVITSLSANQEYDFRVRAMNTGGVMTDFTNIVSTLTVSGVTNFTGLARSSSSINWSWDSAPGATYYELYDVTNGTPTASLIGTTLENNLSQTGLAANMRYIAQVAAVNTTTGYGPIRGPTAVSAGVFTLTVQPLKGTPNVFTSVTTGSFITNWITNGNSTWTVYSLTLSTGATIGTYSTRLSTMAFTGLLPNVRYSVSLTPYNGDSIAGTAVDMGSKYTLAKVPASLALLSRSMSGLMLGWDTAGNSPETIYEVRSSTAFTFAAPIRTHVAFSELQTDNYTFVNGLLTSTTYSFDVAACNGEGVSLGCTPIPPEPVAVGVTARKQSVEIVTLPGPGGAPPGSIGGTSDPSKAVTISGTLPNGRYIAMDIPAGSFPGVTAIAISSFSPTDGTNRCGYLPGGFPVEVAVFSEASSGQPQMPITLTLNFNQDPGKGTIITDAPNLVLARYNPLSGQCLPLETTVNIGLRTITATLNHFSLFQLMKRTAASDLNNVLIYPNPFYANRGQGFVTIDKIPANSKVRIYTLSGEKIWEAAAGTTGVIIWKGMNKSGYLVASGIYLAVIDSTSGKKVFKLAVER